MPKRLLTFLLVPFLFLTSAAAQSTPDATTPLADTVWRAQDPNGDISENIPFDVTFLADGTLHVTTGCPEATGTWQATPANDLTITVEAPADCAEAQATAFYALLESATGYAINDEDGTLALTMADGSSLAFDPALIGVTWEWVEFQSSNDTTTSPKATETNQVTFHQDGSVSIDTPCATGEGTFLDAADGFDVDLAAVDASGCAEDSATALLLRDLDMATSYVIRDGSLWIALPMDGGIHEFTPVFTSATPTA